MKPTPRVRGVPVTVIGTLLLVFVEFALLTGVYHSDDGADRRHEASIRVSAMLQTWQPVDGTTRVVRAVDRLAATSAPGSGTLQRRAAVWSGGPSPARTAGLRTSTNEVVKGAADEQAWADRRAALIFAVLLVLVSIGWFFWFRRLVDRQRELQRTLTAAQVIVAGERRLLALVQNSVDMVAVLEPDSTMSFVSPAARDVLGRTPDDLVGRRFAELLRPEDVPTFVGLLAGSREGDQQVMLHAAHADGRELVVEGTLTNLLADAAVSGWVLTVRDVTDRLNMERELSHQAFHDALTGLPNRRLFGERLAHALRERGRKTEPVMVLYLDLDDFKNVNDGEGHTAGDQVLVAVAERIAATVRQGDTPARLGGDEFAVLMEDADVSTARSVAERLVEGLAEPVRLESVEYSVRASIGIAEAEPGVTTGEEALRNADVAMYWAKERGKGTVAVYEAGLHAAAMARLALGGELKVAIRERQLVVHYQPTVDLETNLIRGFEALVRWQHPDRGLVQPTDFIPIAEQSGLIVPLGAWVLEEACRAGAGMQRDDAAPSIAVNVSTRQLCREEFVDEVLAVLARTGMPPRALVLEITESALLDDKAHVVVALSRLRAVGIRVAIDDFGTGYSSLAYLAELPVDILKLDKAFVDPLGADPGEQLGSGGSLAEAIIEMARTLDLTTIAEGVERASQAAWLQQAHCMLGQGFLWSPAVSLESAHGLLRHGVGSGATIEPGPGRPYDYTADVLVGG